jgi:hypothetical protein
MSAIQALPKDTLTHVLSYGNNRFLGNCAGVNREWRDLMHEPDNISASHGAWRAACQWAKSQEIKIAAPDESPRCDYSQGKLGYNSDRNVFICDLTQISDQRKVLNLVSKNLPQEILPYHFFLIPDCKILKLGQDHVLTADDEVLQFAGPDDASYNMAFKLCEHGKAKFAYDPERGLVAYPKSQNNALILRYASGEKRAINLPIILNLQRYVNTCINGDLIFLCTWRQNAEAGRTEGIINIFSIEERRFIREIVYPHKPIQILTCKDRLVIIENDAYFSLYDLNTFEPIVDSKQIPELGLCGVWSQAMDDEKIVFGTNKGNVFVYSTLDGQLLKKFNASVEGIRDLVLSGNTVAIGCSTGAKLFDLISGDPVHHAPTAKVTSLCLEGKTLVVRDQTGMITINRPIPESQEEKE